jgi:hypothetical protein
MTMRTVVLLLLLLAGNAARAQSVVLIEVDTGRTMSDGGGAVPVMQRAILTLPAAPTDIALLYFRGNPGYMLLNSLEDKQRNLGWIGKGEAELMQAGIALVQIDCPTDQLGDSPRPPATKCLGDYRSSKQHADDVRRLMARLKTQHGLSRIFILGHSLGTVSSRWLAINLGKDEIAGSIHSAALNSFAPQVFDLLGNLPREFPAKSAGAPILNVHNENDACRSTPYNYVKNYSRNDLVTVRGGVPEGDPCGAGHLHSHQGRELAVVNAIIRWIRTGEVATPVGE